MAKKVTTAATFAKTWALSSAATLGSLVRGTGILLELRARLPFAWRKSLNLTGGSLILAMPEGSEDDFGSAAVAISHALEAIESLPVIPREIEDILAISTSERRRWLDDGRLPNAGTRTVKLRGRARQITFHVFDPRIVEELLDRGAVDEWRENDAATRLENRRRAAFEAKLTRSLKKAKRDKAEAGDANSNLTGWEAFRRDGLLR